MVEIKDDGDEYAVDVAAIRRLDVVPTILDVVCRTTGMGFAAVARVTETRWIACSVRDDIGFGLKPGDELKVESTICNEIRDSRQPVVIDHVAQDETFRGHHTPRIYGFQSYISMPVTLPDGSFFGTLCAIDPRPMRLSTPETTGMFKLFADLIAFHLDAQRRLEMSEASLLNEQHDAGLREQFIAVLGHDLRNPLASIASASRVLGRMPLPEQAYPIIGLLQSSVSRMSGMIDNVLDFARGRLGGGLPLETRPKAPLRPILEQVIAELRASHPDSVIDADLGSVDRLRCDPGRIGQMLSNLVGNALTHGASESPVRVTARAGKEFVLSVANAGEPIPETLRSELFKPFFRASSGMNQEGLGLGLYIAHQIARAHGGTLEVTSDAEETCFTFRMRVT
ncbi:GAF domain-containing sensor histidine kinase [Roseomonas marmotae]|uniref:histidine kinase n=1 Tax=Roseomonas marmotae TaxID=2768161 RepID=A0ABS3KBH2_9PROT|nr:GAF domain-containing sensor histidine kinase [Roseomonas marmotae]MBO1074312.1 GAF domain-containing sensor histidine kinase [Roseomonas marmotae]QTI78065.1 GAF domain-containing sensor histidine kinase [Roseomonas marmotae]